MNDWDGKNRRRFTRVSAPYTIHIFTLKGRPIATYTEDLSSGGVRVTLREKLAVSELVDLKIYIGDEFVHCKGKIAWIKEQASSVLDGILFYEAGLEFVDLKAGDQELIGRCVNGVESKQKNKGKK